ncbi:MAG: DUF5615 family PIN-like protein [Hormoscilla sp. GUM202]|nr:DUF5615 family PIN-like protein [Hormoscilla sp. GUM202]
MNIHYLIDENLPPLYREQLSRRQPDLTVWMVGDPGVPPKSTLDPEILIWCEVNNSILVTDNRTSMPVHLAEHLTQKRWSLGIFALRQKATIGKIIEDLILIARAGDPKDYPDRITYIPL